MNREIDNFIVKFCRWPISILFKKNAFQLKAPHIRLANRKSKHKQVDLDTHWHFNDLDQVYDLNFWHANPSLTNVQMSKHFPIFDLDPVTLIFKHDLIRSRSTTMPKMQFLLSTQFKSYSLKRWMDTQTSTYGQTTQTLRKHYLSAYAGANKLNVWKMIHYTSMEMGIAQNYLWNVSVVNTCTYYRGVHEVLFFWFLVSCTGLFVQRTLFIIFYTFSYYP